MALCSIGPILSVLLLGMLYQASGQLHPRPSHPDQHPGPVAVFFGEALPVCKGGRPGAGADLRLFGLFQLVSLKLKRKALARILIGGPTPASG